MLSKAVTAIILAVSFPVGSNFRIFPDNAGKIPEIVVCGVRSDELHVSKDVCDSEGFIVADIDQKNFFLVHKLTGEVVKVRIK